MALTAQDPNAERVSRENYSVTKVDRDPADICKNPVIERIETAGALEGICKFSAQTAIPTGVKGRTGSFQKYSSATMWSDGIPIRLSMRSKYSNPGSVFAGEVEVTLTYPLKANKKDLDKIRYALSGAGLKPCKE